MHETAPRMGLTYDEYAGLPGLRASDLLRLAQSPLHYRAGAPPRRTDRGFFHLVHAAVLEPHTLPEQYAVWTGAVRRGKAYDAWRAEQAGRAVVTTAEMQRAMVAATSILGHPTAGPLLTAPGESELTITWTERGRPMKGRIDRLAQLPGGRYALIDLKTYGTTQPRAVARMVAKHGAHVQLAHYRAGLVEALGLPAEAIDVYLVSAEGRHPYDVAVLQLAADGALARGVEERERLLDLLDTCEAEDSWPGCSPGVTELVLPAWAGGDVDDVSFTDATEDMSDEPDF